MSGMRLIREMKENGIEPKPHHAYIMNFRRQLTTSPHLIREIDHLTGKDRDHVPMWEKVGGRKPKPEYRNVSPKERKAIANEPAFLSPKNFPSRE